MHGAAEGHKERKLKLKYFVSLFFQHSTRGYFVVNTMKYHLCRNTECICVATNYIGAGNPPYSIYNFVYNN
jgi:hypothetical protein